MKKTKRRIFKTAIKLFAEKGFENAGIEEITAVSGVAKGSFYYHFETKEEIFDTLLETGYNLLINSIEIKYRNCKNNKEKLQAVVLILLKVVALYEEFFTVVVTNSLGKNDRSIKCQEKIHKLILIISNLIEDGILSGEFKKCDSEATAYYIFGIVYSTILYRIKNNNEIDSGIIYEKYINNILNGIS
mgnify:CR=1 FL=1